MDFNFGNNNENTDNSEQENNIFSFDPEKVDASASANDSDGGTPFTWTPDGTSSDDQDQQNDIELENSIEDDSIDESFSQSIPDNAVDETEEVAVDFIDEVSDEPSTVPPLEEDANMFEESSDISPDAFDPEAEVEPESEAVVSDDDIIEDEASEDEVSEDDAELVSEEDSQTDDELPPPFGAVEEAPTEEPVSVPAALDKKVRTPDGEQEFLLSELIDVETGAPLDLTSLIPAELLASATSTAPNASIGLFSGAAESTAGGFDMSAGQETAGGATTKRKRAPRPKASGKGGGLAGIVLGGVLAVLVFPYLMYLIKITTGLESNIPIPAPGIPATYQYIPEWWPEWGMFIFPGKTTDTPDQPANATVTPADDKGANPQEADANNPPEEPAAAPAPEENNAADPVPEETTPADVGAEDFDPDAFLANGANEENAKPSEEAPVDDSANETAQPAQPGVINAPSYTSNDVSEAVASVGAAYKTAKAIDDAVYSALNDMAEKSTFVDTSVVDAQLKDSMDKVRKAMGKFGTNETFQTVLSDKWESRSADASDDAGVMLVGTVESVSQRDGYQINTVAIDGKDGLTIEVVGTRKIKPGVGDKVVVCGKRIANPEKNLGGFTDNGVPVIWGGIVIKAETK